ncbi:tRNA lysidine(34) synthetase TilS [Blattabacterium cuenoti]|uniref:tRNA lysidine(34) synthetase TilS n=1 Tax=Blattabacterium cuenoti TaxID=1653831 RepID=UPI00163C0E73|nr:tRNA lysidine(34) synthetase TilS [Blattabacterium cuenoti]
MEKIGKNDLFFLEKIQKNFSFEKKKICVSVSGGIDSMVLLHLLLLIPNTLLEVAHCNFSLRNKESDEDEIFVQKFCMKKKILCHIKKFDTLKFSIKHKLSVQMSARELRYKWFDELLKNNLYDYLVLGHHLNDSIETFIMNIIRGTGIKGLLGIPFIRNNKIIRPLFNFTKKEIIHYAKIKKIDYRLDSSNLKNCYLRNQIRNSTSYFPNSFYKGFKKSIKFLYRENLFIEKQILKIQESITVEKKNKPFFYWKISCEKIKKLQQRSFFLYKIFFSYGFFHVKNLINFLDSQSGKKLQSKKYSLIKNRNHWLLVSNLFFEKKNKIYIISNLKYISTLPFKIEFFLLPKEEKIKKDIKTSFIDFDKIQFPLLLRTWKKGDFFFPLNMKGKKKISKYYKDKKISILEKELTWLLVNGNGNIILIFGQRLDDRYKITDKTKNILKIKI